MFIFHCVSREVTAERWGKVMAKPLANHVIAGRRHEHTYAHSQSALTPRLLLPDTQTSALFLSRLRGQWCRHALAAPLCGDPDAKAERRDLQQHCENTGSTTTESSSWSTHWIVSLLLVEMVFRMTETVCPSVCVFNECLHPEILQNSPPPGLKGEWSVWECVAN